VQFGKISIPSPSKVIQNPKDWGSDQSFLKKHVKLNWISFHKGWQGVVKSINPLWRGMIIFCSGAFY